MVWRVLLPIALLCLGATAARAPLENGLARTPPMGWNSWNHFGCDVSDRLIRETADAMVASGMRDAGYRYVVIDDCWQVVRDAQGRLVADSARFPDGIKPLADYVHAQGLKFGIYTDAGRKTCQGRPGTYGHEMEDARTFASWGVDYVKEDWCYADSLDAPVQYGKFRDALRAARRPIVLSICEWGSFSPWDWGPTTGHLWRTTTDIEDKWTSVLDNLDISAQHAAAARPGAWNDPDMLEVGNGGMTDGEYRAHFSLWAIMAAPLIAGNDLRTMTPATRDILTNREVIAVDQDSLGVQGTVVQEDPPEHQVWVKPLRDGSRAVVLLNRSITADSITATWWRLRLPAGPALVRDLWAHADVGTFTDKFTTLVPAHGAVMVRVSH
ncbi:MAG: alpha-galactosidase [Gemmatimonadetes bacterium 13_1_40CM_4_69_8]|nr:MAG: alpha-galactosidase [Gemmatimonadetes bacterium 13_1_40CM_4_69_8]PYP73896.1 MAG: alpha-galactosidase [Gemmatimonadota bacterium]